MNVAVLVGSAIAIVVGVAMIPMIMDSVNIVQSSEEVPPAVSSLAGVLPIVFLAVLILGVVAFIGFRSGDSEESSDAKSPPKKKETVVRVENKAAESYKSPKYFDLSNAKEKEQLLDGENDIVVQK